jgi:hypothetical protein
VNATESSAALAAPEAVSGNGRHETPAPRAEHEAPHAERPSEAEQRGYHAEPREAGPAHEATPIAHFEPSPRPEPSGGGKPYVVWSSTPAPKDEGSHGPEE